MGDEEVPGVVGGPVGPGRIGPVLGRLDGDRAAVGLAPVADERPEGVGLVGGEAAGVRRQLQLLRRLATSIA